MKLTAGLLAVFFAMQVAANLLFAHGSRVPGHWWLGFILGNIVGAGSIWPMMLIYQRLQPNIALALAGGGTFVAVQIALAWAFGGQLNRIQWLGVALIAVGIVMAALCGPSAARR